MNDDDTGELFLSCLIDVVNGKCILVTLAFWFILFMICSKSKTKIKHCQECELFIHRMLLLANESMYVITLFNIKCYTSLSMCVCASLFFFRWLVCSYSQVSVLPGCGGGAACVWKSWIKSKRTLSDINTSATSLSSGTMVTSRSLTPPSAIFTFYLFFLYSPIPILVYTFCSVETGEHMEEWSSSNSSVSFYWYRFTRQLFTRCTDDKVHITVTLWKQFLGEQLPPFLTLSLRLFSCSLMIREVMCQGMEIVIVCCHNMIGNRILDSSKRNIERY